MTRVSVLVTVILLAAGAGGCGSREPAPSPPATSAAPSDSAWPPLPTTGFVSGRAATREDAQAGNAVFVLRDGDGHPGTKPLDIVIPQYAIFVDTERHERRRVFIVQGEQFDSMVMIGYRDIATGELGIGAPTDFELLGLHPR